jgi:competence protein ComEC
MGHNWQTVKSRAMPSFWQAPLVPAALALTAGIVADRYLDLPSFWTLAGALAGLAAWALAWTSRQVNLALVYLLASLAALGAVYHHGYREWFAADDVSCFAKDEPRPVVLRGVLDEEPALSPALPHDPLRTLDRRIITRTVLRVTAIRQRVGWTPASGRAALIVAGALHQVHVGDEVEIVGRLLRPRRPSNPGEADYASFLRDQRICAQVWVREQEESVRLLAEGSPLSPAGWLAAVRGWAHRALEELLPPEQHGLAMALLLGENHMLQSSEWEKYQRSGVIHVLAISGQHLSILAAFLWPLLRLVRLSRRKAACLLAVFLLSYALLTGGRPPIMRAAVMVLALCGGILLGRPTQLPNLFALAWIVVVLLNPTDVGDAGCQLSFLSVAILFWGLPKGGNEADSLTQLKDQFRPAWQRGLRHLLGRGAAAYGVTLAICLAVAPLVAFRYHLVSLLGLLLGPPVVLLAALALLAGFAVLGLALVCWPLAQAVALLLRLGLAGCDGFVQFGVRVPGAYWYVPNLPQWWVWLFYLSLLAGLTVPALRQRWRQVGLVLLVWLCVGLFALAGRTYDPVELRCTFLAVGHGGCTVLETPDGRVLLYDVGSLAGPDVARRYVAPYLWQRGIRRIDEVFLSHADLDHFNGLVDLLDRFAIGQVSLTPTFAERQTEGAQLTLAILRRHGVPTRMVKSGDHLWAGDVILDVLHPPPGRLGENENARSLVLLVRHAGHSFLLTGDLDGAGRQRVLTLPRLAVDVLQAPHHGSRTANTEELAKWARPQVVISCQGPPLWPARGPDPYAAIHARVLSTWHHGAVTLRSSSAGLMVEAFRTGEHWRLGP